MKLVVGLGNPGSKYEGTRHNVGWQVLAELMERGGKPRTKKAFQGEVAELTVHGERTLLLWPHTFMNRSGSSVLEARDFYKIETPRILIVCDDFNLPLAKLRFRATGSSGGQKGIADVIRVLGTEDVPRMRVGIGAVPEHWEGVDYVLGKFTRQEAPIVADAMTRAAEAIETWVTRGLPYCMNQYN